VPTLKRETTLDTKSHNRIIPSSDPEARVRPSGDQAMLLLALLGVLWSARSLPVFASHKNKKKLFAEASKFPSGDQAML
jgi:hypothetical protein